MFPKNSTMLRCISCVLKSSILNRMYFTIANKLIKKSIFYYILRRKCRIKTEQFKKQQWSFRLLIYLKFNFIKFGRYWSMITFLNLINLLYSSKENLNLREKQNIRETNFVINLWHDGHKGIFDICLGN